MHVIITKKPVFAEETFSVQPNCKYVSDNCTAISENIYNIYFDIFFTLSENFLKIWKVFHFNRKKKD